MDSHDDRVDDVDDSEVGGNDDDNYDDREVGNFDDGIAKMTLAMTLTMTEE